MFLAQDMMNKEFMMQQGGVSKATKMLNLSEASQSSYHLNQLKMSMARDVFHIDERLKDELLPLDLLIDVTWIAGHFRWYGLHIKARDDW